MSDNHLNENIEVAKVQADPQKGPFTVRQLIEALQKCKNQDAPVNAYLLEWGTRLPITRVDDGFDDNRMVDLNVNDDYLFDNEKGDDRCADQQ